MGPQYQILVKSNFSFTLPSLFSKTEPLQILCNFWALNWRLALYPCCCCKQKVTGYICPSRYLGWDATVPVKIFTGTPLSWQTSTHQQLLGNIYDTRTQHSLLPNSRCQQNHVCPLLAVWICFLQFCYEERSVKTKTFQWHDITSARKQTYITCESTARNQQVNFFSCKL
jgi:hypothetical protein